MWFLFERNGLSPESSTQVNGAENEISNRKICNFYELANEIYKPLASKKFATEHSLSNRNCKPWLLSWKRFPSWLIPLYVCKDGPWAKLRAKGVWGRKKSGKNEKPFPWSRKNEIQVGSYHKHSNVINYVNETVFMTSMPMKCEKKREWSRRKFIYTQRMQTKRIRVFKNIFKISKRTSDEFAWLA